MAIGDKLNILLEKRNRNINELAMSINVSPQTLYSIAKRNNTKVDLDILQKIADELSVTLDYFCTDSKKAELFNIDMRISDIDKQFIDDYLNLSYQGKEYMLETMELAKIRYKKDILSSEENNIG